MNAETGNVVKVGSKLCEKTDFIDDDQYDEYQNTKSFAICAEDSSKLML